VNLTVFASAMLLAFSAAPANAALLTFDGVAIGGIGCPPGPGSVVESGFTISNCPGYFIEPGEIHLDDGGTGFSSFVDFSSDMRFDAVSVAIQNFGESYFVDDITWQSVPYDNVLFTGYRDGVLVASQGYSSFAVAAFATEVVLFDSDFAALDLLRIAQVFPSIEEQFLHPDAYCVDVPCGHVSLKEITLAPVPLPAGLPLLAGALALLGFAASRRRCAAG
jgi:hypothetical protein